MQGKNISDWNANLYDRFADERSRAARDLLAAVPERHVERICDLGCGSGLSSQIALARWPTALLTGVDRSPDMLTKARERLPQARWLERDIAEYEPAAAQDLIVANASLHWLDDHLTLFPRLISHLRPGGTLAVQMPNNLQEPSHSLMRVTASMHDYRDHLATIERHRSALLKSEEYYDCLSPSCARILLWETRYVHTLANASAIVDWFESTGLKPFIDGLPAHKRDAFRREYSKAVTSAYPARADGKVLLTMPRLFIVAQRRD